MPKTSTADSEGRPRKGKSAGYLANTELRARKAQEGDEDAATSSPRKKPRVTKAQESGAIETEKLVNGTITGRKEKSRKTPTGKESTSRSKSRTKPGAALALAQRQSVAILPSQGSKIVF
jgi:hypothetical protein